MMTSTRIICVALLFFALAVSNSGAQVSQLKFASVDDLLKCFTCCADLFADDNSLIRAACQSGCNNLIDAIDDTVQAQANSFKAGDDFRRLGKTQFNNNNYFCSAGGSVQRIFDDVLQNDCINCCESLSVNFDINQTYSLDACQAACVNDFNQDCNDLPLVQDQQGCAIALLFRQEGGANFLQGTNHFCSNIGELFSIQAIEIGKVDVANVALVSECDICCVEVSDELGIDSAQCQLGCDPTKDCAVDAAVQADCELGRSLATTSIARISDTSQITCVAPGSTEKFVNLNELNVGLKPEDFAIIFGSVFGAVFAMAFVAWFVSRKSKTTTEREMTEQTKPKASRFGLFNFKKDIVVISYPRENRSNPVPAPKARFFGLFKRSEVSTTNDKYTQQNEGSKGRFNLFRFFQRKKEGADPGPPPQWQRSNEYSFEPQNRTDPAPRWNNDNSYRMQEGGYRDDETEYTRREPEASPQYGNRRPRNPDGSPASSKLRIMAARR